MTLIYFRELLTDLQGSGGISKFQQYNLERGKVGEEWKGIPFMALWCSGDVHSVRSQPAEL